MLDTLLEIGKTLRESGRLRHHRYIKRAPQGDKKTEVVYFSFPVREDFSFDFENISRITDEDFIKHELFYLAYKTSDSDNQVKYVFGDINFGMNAKGDYFPGTYYQLAEPDKTSHKRKSSFERGEDLVVAFKETAIEKFRKSYSENREFIENFLKENGDGKICYLHFDFQGKHWHQFEDELKAVNSKLLDDFVKKQNGKFVLRKSLYKTLASPEKNLPFPNFTAENIYKTKIFESSEEVLDLLYAIDYSTKAVITDNSIKIIILPKGKDLKPDEIEEFFERERMKKSSGTQKLENEALEENKLKPKNQSNDLAGFYDSLFNAPLYEVAENVNEYDFIFSKSGGVSAPDVDMIELAGIERSHLEKTGKRVGAIRQKVEAERSELIKSDKIGLLDIRRSFLNILGDVTKDKKKYQSHLLKVLPQIYTGTYNRDDLLLPTFIEKAEYNIRNESANYNLLKFDYEFLTRLRGNENNKIGDEEMKNMFESPSFKAGKLLGQLSQPVSWEIKSFEKNYVGLLSRRIADIDSLMDFAGFICEKLAIHERAYQNLKDKYAEFMSEIKKIHQDYDRRYFVVGFFEGYFAKFEKPERQVETTATQTNLEEKIQ